MLPSCTDNTKTTLESINIIPKPQQITTGVGSFKIGKKVYYTPKSCSNMQI